MPRPASSVQRNALRAVQAYSWGLGRRGRMTYAEVRGMRSLMDLQLTRAPFRPAPGTLVEPVRAPFDGGQVRGEWVEQPGVVTRERSVLLYVHGGAFVAGSPRTHRGLTAELAGRLHRSVFAVDYRLAPGHRFPAAADDVLRAYRWLLDAGLPASAITVAGDSAGGHLTLGLSPRLRRAGLPLPSAVVAFSPVVDPGMRVGAQWELEHGRDRFFDARTGRAVMRLYRGRGVADTHPELLLTGDDLADLPPTLVQASSSELLAGDAEAYVAAAQAAGSEVRLQTWPRQMHVFQIAFRLSRSAREALDAVEQFVADVEAAAVPTS